MSRFADCPRLQVKALLFGLAASAFGAGLYGAALRWESTRLDVVLPPEQRHAVLRFKFTNQSANPVTVTALRVQCHCTTARLESGQTVIAPSASGVVVADFAAGALAGRVERDIVIETDEPGEKSYRLTFGATLQSYLSLEPSMVYWPPGDTRERTVVCSAQSPANIKLTGAAGRTPGVRAEIEPIEPGRAYRLRLWPTTAKPEIVLVEIAADIDGVGSRGFSLFAKIQ